MDDGLTSHLEYSIIPETLILASTSGEEIDLGKLPGLIILFCYPRTAAPNKSVPEEWNNTPGARGCTAEACSYRDSFTNLKSLGATAIYGVSTQDTSFQKEVKQRLGLPFDLLSDECLELMKMMGMPSMKWKGEELLKRCTLAVKDGVIVKVWYPVFPPDENAGEVGKWLKEYSK